MNPVENILCKCRHDDRAAFLRSTITSIHETAEFSCWSSLTIRFCIPYFPNHRRVRSRSHFDDTILPSSKTDFGSTLCHVAASLEKSPWHMHYTFRQRYKSTTRLAVERRLRCKSFMDENPLSTQDRSHQVLACSKLFQLPKLFNLHESYWIWVAYEFQCVPNCCGNYGEFFL